MTEEDKKAIERMMERWSGALRRMGDVHDFKDGRHSIQCWCRLLDLESDERDP